MRAPVTLHHISRCLTLLKEQEEHFDIIFDGVEDNFWGLKCLHHISKCLGLLKEQEERFDGIVDGATLKDHFCSLKQGLEFLDKILSLSTYDTLKHNINNLVVNVERKLDSLTYGNGDGSSVTADLDSAYSGLRREMKNVIVTQGGDEFVAVFHYSQNDVLVSDVVKANDFLLENIGEFMMSRYNESNGTAPLREELQEIRNVFEDFKLLFASENLYRESYANDEEGHLLTRLVSVLDKATCIIYSCLVGKIDEELMTPLFKNMLSKLLMEAKSLKADLVPLTSSIPGTSNLGLGRPRSKLSDPNNMKQLVEGKEKYLNVELSQLHERMNNLSDSLMNPKDNDAGIENPLYVEEYIEALFRESKNSFIVFEKGMKNL